MPSCTDPATCAALEEWELRHVALRLDVEMHARRLTGTAQLRFQRGPAATVASSLRLDVFRLRVHSVAARSVGDVELLTAAFRVLPFTAFGDALEVELPPATLGAHELELVVEYETTPESPGVCWLAEQQTAGKQLPYMYTQGQEVLNRSVFPCQDSPSVRITYSASVVVPSELMCVMSAKLCGVETVDEQEAPKKRFNFEMQQSIPVYLVAMAVGDLVSAEVGPRSSIWTEPCMLEASKKEFEGVIEKYLRAGEELFGEYQWERYDVLVMPPSFPYGGMENPRLTFVSPSLIAGDQSLSSGTDLQLRDGEVLLICALITCSRYAVIAHEISHSWHVLLSLGSLM